MPNILLVDYRSDWPLVYAEAAGPLAAAFGPYAADIQHIGSTSVPGLAAKPIIDIAIGITQYPLPDAIIDAVTRLGYEHKGEYGIPGRHYFRKPGPPYGFHIHATGLQSSEYHNHILFRDYLRAHPDAAREYQLLKRDLAAHWVDDFEAYAAAKTSFVRQILLKAEAWRAGHAS
jgi:GrpB-like predicted nucleotidyltransferase (UPF0157 family)